MKTFDIEGIHAMPRIRPLRNSESAKTLIPDLSPPPRGTRGAVTIGELIAPLQRIIRHPERNRMLADFIHRCEAEQ